MYYQLKKKDWTNDEDEHTRSINARESEVDYAIVLSRLSTLQRNVAEDTPYMYASFDLWAHEVASGGELTQQGRLSRPSGAKSSRGMVSILTGLIS